MSTVITQPKSESQSEISPKNTIPSEIKLRLEGMVQRIRRDIWLRGVLTVAASTLLVLIVLIGLDIQFQLEAFWIRSLLMCLGLVTIAAATHKFILHPLRQKCNELEVAWTLENDNPEMEERLTSTLQFANEKSQNKESQRLMEVVADQAKECVENVNDDVTTNSFLLPLFATGLCTLILLLSLLIWPQSFLASMSNVLNPWNNRVLPQLTALISPGDVNVAEGDSVSIEVANQNGMSHASLEILSEETVLSTHSMVVSDEGDSAQFLLSDLTNDISYRIQSSGLYSREFNIKVYPKPVVQQIAVELTYPEYTNLPPETITDSKQIIEAPVGTHGTVTVQTMAEAKNALLELNEKKLPVERISQADSGNWLHQWELNITKDLDSIATITLTNELGITSEPEQLHLRSVEDTPPSILLVLPVQRQLTVKPQQQIPIYYDLVDDFGLTDLRVITSIEDQESLGKSLLSKQARSLTEHSGETLLDMADFKLEPDEKLFFWLQATDNRPEQYGGNQSVISEKIEVKVDENAAILGQQLIQNEQQHLDQSLTLVINKLESAKESTRQLSKLLDRNQKITQEKSNPNINEDKSGKKNESDEVNDIPIESKEIRESAKEIRKQINEAKQELNQIISDEQRSPSMFESQISQLEDISQKEISEAQRQANRIPLANDTLEMQDAAKNAQESLENSIQKLQEIQTEINERTNELKLASELDELARKQDQLAKEMQQQDGVDSQFEERQEAVADQLQQIVENDDDAKSEQFLQRADQAQQLANEANNLSQQQEQLAQIDQADKNEFSDIEVTKKQLLEMIAKEQEAITSQVQQLELENRFKEQEREQFDKAREQMQIVTDELRQDNQEQAEVAAQKALEELQNSELSDKNPTPKKENNLKPNSPQQNKDKQKNPDANNQNATQNHDVITREQARIAEAIAAVNEDRLDEAVAKLQDQIADRTEQLQAKANEVLMEPTQDVENKKAVEDAKQQLEDAKEKTKAANELTKQQLEKNRNPQEQQPMQQPAQQGKPQEQQPIQQPGQQGKPQEQQPMQQPGQQGKPQEQQPMQQPGQQGKPQEQQPVQQPGQQGKPQDQQPMQQPGQQGKPQDQQPMQQPGQKGKPQEQQPMQQPGQQGKPQEQQPMQQPAQQGKPQEQQPMQQPGQQGKPHEQQPMQQPGQQGKPQEQLPMQQLGQQGKPQEQQPMQQPGQQGKPQDQQPMQQPGQQGKPQEQQPMQQLGQQGKPQEQQPMQQPGQQGKPQDQKANQQKKEAVNSLQKAANLLKRFCQSCKECANCNKPSSGGGKPSSKPSSSKSKSGKPSPQQLAKAAEKANRSAQAPSRQSTQETAKELGKLADEVAKKTNYPLRKPEQNMNQPMNKGEKEGQSNSNSPSPQLSTNQRPVGNVTGPELGLRGGTSSNWARSRKKLNGNVLNDKNHNVPEEFRDVVEGYFEELSRQESNFNKSDTVKGDR